MEKLLVIPSQEKDLGGFSVRRVLPSLKRRMVGPFLFFDHMGPADFPPGQGIDVRPHPHIHLATVTYLFEGKIHHRDSLGSDQLIEPGAINWMTAGRGIVHSERTPAYLRKEGYRLNGIQCWIALPDGSEDLPPSFTHYPADALPEFAEADACLKLLAGSLFGRTSPVRVHSDLFYADVALPADGRLTLPCDGREGAAYLVSGRLQAGEITLESHSMVLGQVGEDLPLRALEPCRFVLLGGSPLGKRHMYWNFVSSAQANIEQAKAEWAQGPGNTERFPLIPGDDLEFIPLPEEEPNPPGTIL
jgi:redox-sensitive bicupin YhaK (pirin superfamily)